MILMFAIGVRRDSEKISLFRLLFLQEFSRCLKVSENERFIFKN